jgi:NitT/TauT family transport system permease protein
MSKVAAARTTLSRSEAKERAPWFDRVPPGLSMVGVVTALVLIWQFVYSSNMISTIILPSPAETWEEILFVGQNLVTGGYMLTELGITIQEVIVGFALSTIFGIALGVIVGESRFGQKVIMPLLVLVNAMPKVAFAPVFIAWLGFGVSSKIVMAAFIAIFPVIVSTTAGMFSVDSLQLKLFRSMGASRWQTLIKLKFPAALPFVFAGLKTAAVFCVVGAIIGEFLGGGSGFGELVRIAATQIRIDRVFALILYLSLIGLALFWLVTWVQRRIVFWQSEDIIEVGSA